MTERGERFWQEGCYVGGNNLLERNRYGISRNNKVSFHVGQVDDEHELYLTIHKAFESMPSQCQNSLPNKMNEQEANNNATNNVLLKQQFQAITNSSDDEACQYLEMSNYDLEMAVGLYMEVHGDGEVVVEGDDGGADDDINVANVDNTYCVGNNDSNIDALEDNLLEEPGIKIMDERDEEEGGASGEEEEDENENNTTFDTLCNQIISPSVDIATTVHVSEHKTDHGASCNTENSEDEDIASLTSDSPNYDHLGLDCAELSASVFDEFTLKDDSMDLQDDGLQLASNHNKMEKIGEHEKENEYNFYAAVEEENELLEDDGEEYILGTMMVRVLQARHVKVCFISVTHTVLFVFIVCDIILIMLCVLITNIISYTSNTNYSPILTITKVGI